MSAVQPFLSGNQRFREGEFQEEAELYSALARGQHPTLLWIGCSDSRVSETTVTQSKPGDIFVYRNVANLVAFNDVGLSAVLTYGLEHLKIRDVVVCGHLKCGGVQAMCVGVQQAAISDWLLIGGGAVEAGGGEWDAVVRTNVELQVKHLSKMAVVRKAKPRLHGWVYDLATGGLEVVVDGAGADDAQRA